MRTAASCAAFVFFWPRVVLLAFVTALLQSPPTPRTSFGMEERPPKHVGEQVAEHLLPVDEPSRQRRRTAVELRARRSDPGEQGDDALPAKGIFPQLKSYQTTSVDCLICTRGADIGTRDP